jgi:hypothetical protein
MKINDEKHEVREELDSLTYDTLAGQDCDHTWRLIDDEAIEECVFCGKERDIFIDLSKLVYLREHGE